MTVISTQAIQEEQIKLRWQEPYVSAALNNKTYKTLPRGVYRGFSVVPNGGLTIKIGTGGPSGTLGYQGGNYDAGGFLGWSVAVHENHNGYSATIIMQEGVNSDFIFDLSVSANTSVYAVLDVQYILGFPSAGQIKVVDAAELDLNPTLLVLAKIDVPATTIQLSNIVLNDAQYPRVLPFANMTKMGFMSPTQANIVDLLALPNASPAFEVEFEALVSGSQVITLPSAHLYTVNGNDLFIFKNGVKMKKGRDYSEIDRGDGFGEQISWIGNIIPGDRILFRGQEYAVTLNNALAVQDEGSEVSANVVRMNFAGNGVLVIPDGPGRVKIIIPSPPGAGGSPSKQKLNSTGTLIPQATCVCLNSDGTIAPFDPRDLTKRPFGITSGAIPDGEVGTVVLAGVGLNMLFSLGGFSTGEDVFVSDSGAGNLTTTPPNPVTSAVWRVGTADCADEDIPSTTAKDLIIQFQQLI